MIKGPDLSQEIAELRAKVAAEPDNFGARGELAEALFGLGLVSAAVEQLYTTAERLGHSQQYADGIETLNQLLERVPGHENAQRLLAQFYAAVPRSRPAQDFATKMFGFPNESAEVLSRILPFDEEDPAPIADKVVVRVPAGPSESPRPLLAALDKELRRLSKVVFPAQQAVQFEDVRPPVRPVDMGELALREVSRSGKAGYERISPASQLISLDELPPNPLLDLLGPDSVSALLQRIDLLHIRANVTIIDNWTRSRCLYVVVQGRLAVVRDVDGHGLATVDEIRAGEFFGEFELLTCVATDAEITSLDPTEVLEIPEHLLDRLIQQRPETGSMLWDAYFQRSFHSMLATSKIFSPLPLAVIHDISVELEPLLFEAGDIVLREGEFPRGLYGIVGGSLAVIKSSEAPPQVLTRLAPGDFFGLVSSAQGQPISATVVATEESAAVWLPLDAIERFRLRMPAFQELIDDASRGRIWQYQLLVS